MELVYLWVKEYKNIQKQGFDFSPRFKCEYDEDTKNLKIIDKEETGEVYPKNFFGENINITAIVGENGSGKSSLVKLFEKIFLDKDDEKYIFISLINEKLFIYTNLIIKKILTKYETESIFPNNLSLCSYNAEMPYPYEERKDLHYKNEFYTINLQEKYIYKLMSSIIKNGENEIINFVSKIFKPTEMRITENISYKKSIKDKIESIMPGDFPFKEIELGNDNIKEKLVYKKYVLIDTLIDELYDDGRYDDFLYDEAEKIFEKDKELYRKNSTVDGRPASDDEILDFFRDEVFEKNPPERYVVDTLDKKELYNFFRENIYSCLYNYFIPSFIFKNDNDSELIKKPNVYKYLIFYKIVNNELLDVFLNFIINDYFDSVYTPEIESLDELIKNIFDDMNINKVEQFLKEEKISIDINCSEFESLKSQKPNIDDKKYFEDYYELFTFEFFDENGKKFSDLSHGEKIFYGQILNIYFYSLSSNIKGNLTLCFDEPEISLHPMWQKEYLNRFINFIKTLDKNIHLVFTSHSPFLLSDLPKQNVIFLEKDEKTGNCINATNKVDINPFGANIHTLLSHGFFMKDGLMGEFAKSKIDNVIKYLNNDKDTTISSDNDAQNIISIIGEPIIKRELQRMLKNKMELSNKTEIDKIREKVDTLTKELEESSKRLEELENKDKK
ncbi:AAA family ATPase [Halarcobacter sp.]|uniref:AAA family ATPase n=1 Tax=Halarcobacter sp. TaxID=2321133 RepID=UPI002AAADDE0|nr:AAA family ATPase [Halarcobacter sp.]